MMIQHGGWPHSLRMMPIIHEKHNEKQKVFNESMMDSHE